MMTHGRCPTVLNDLRSGIFFFFSGSEEDFSRGAPKPASICMAFAARSMEEDILSAGCRFHADIVAEIALVNNTLE